MYANDLITDCGKHSFHFKRNSVASTIQLCKNSSTTQAMSVGKGHNYLIHCLFHCLFIVKGKIGPCFKTVVNLKFRSNNWAIICLFFMFFFWLRLILGSIFYSVGFLYLFYASSIQFWSLYICNVIFKKFYWSIVG